MRLQALSVAHRKTDSYFCTARAVSQTKVTVKETAAWMLELKSAGPAQKSMANMYASRIGAVIKPGLHAPSRVDRRLCRLHPSHPVCGKNLNR